MSDVLCKVCEKPMEYVDEPMVTGFRGYLCTNDNCPHDS